MAPRCWWPHPPALPIRRNRNGPKVWLLGAGYPRNPPERGLPAVRPDAQQGRGHDGIAPLRLNCALARRFPAATGVIKAQAPTR
jgi:hypothetical protein